MAKIKESFYDDTFDSSKQSYMSNIGDLVKREEDKENDYKEVMSNSVDVINNGDELPITSIIRNRKDRTNILSEMVSDPYIKELTKPIIDIINKDGLVNDIINGKVPPPKYFNPNHNNNKEISLVVKEEVLGFNDYEIDINNKVDDNYNVSNELENRFKNDYLCIFDDYMMNLNDLLAEYMKEIFILADNSNASINELIMPYEQNSNSLPMKYRYYGDRIIFLNHKKNQAILQYEKLYSAKTLLSINRSCKICLQEQQRILDLELNTNGSDYIDSFQQKTYMDIISKRQYIYRKRMKTLYEVLSSALYSYEEILKMDLEIKRNKTILINAGIQLY